MINPEHVSELASCFTPVTDIAILLDVSELELRTAIADKESPVSKAYHRAKAEAALSIRRRDISLAEAGSPTAADAVREHMLRMEADD